VWLESAAAREGAVGGDGKEGARRRQAWPVGDGGTAAGAERRDICLRWLRDTLDQGRDDARREALGSNTEGRVEDHSNVGMS
jgi:hypothetical protein